MSYSCEHVHEVSDKTQDEDVVRKLWQTHEPFNSSYMTGIVLWGIHEISTTRERNCDTWASMCYIYLGNKFSDIWTWTENNTAVIVL